VIKGLDVRFRGDKGFGCGPITYCDLHTRGWRPSSELTSKRLQVTTTDIKHERAVMVGSSWCFGK
jgi:hypothetical protein